VVRGNQFLPGPTSADAPASAPTTPVPAPAAAAPLSRLGTVPNTRTRPRHHTQARMPASTRGFAALEAIALTRRIVPRPPEASGGIAKPCRIEVPKGRPACLPPPGRVNCRVFAWGDEHG